MLHGIRVFLSDLFGRWTIPNIDIIDIVEILIIALIAYRIMSWMKNTKAWMLLKGLLLLVFFIFVATLLQMRTILFIGQQSLNVLAIAAVVVFQPELRRALEKLGEKDFLSTIIPFDTKHENLRFSIKTLDAIVEACDRLSKEKTGALIVVEQATMLNEYVSTGIALDSAISEQLLINIFDGNTPLHDGAVIIRGDRIAAATCYLPLSENMLVSKDLGTRHRAALGMTEVSDALVLIVSEETGATSVSVGGSLERNISIADVRRHLRKIQLMAPEPKKIKGQKKEKKHEKA
jgi:diadenylate cyclase